MTNPLAGGPEDAPRKPDDPQPSPHGRDLAQLPSSGRPRRTRPCSTAESRATAAAVSYIMVTLGFRRASRQAVLRLIPDRRRPDTLRT